MNNKQRIAAVFAVLALTATTVSASDMPSYDLEEIIVTANADRPAMTTDALNA